MSAIENDPLGGNGPGKVRRKSNNTKKLKTVKRQAKDSPEVMVKITGFGKGGKHVKAHLDYITRNGDLELETDRGDILKGKEEVKEFFKEWSKDFSDSQRYKNQRDTMHMVLSMPENTPHEAVREAARRFAKETFGKNHEYVFALHTDEPHPHVHLTVKMRGFNGKRLNPRKADLQSWREGFALQMRDQGIEAEATPRVSRGVVRKPEKAVVRHIERGDKTHPPRVPQVKALQVKEAANELSAERQGAMLYPHPIRDRVKAVHYRVRAELKDLASQVEAGEFKLGGKPNERPNYGRLDAARARAGQLAAAVYQSDLAKSLRKTATAAVTRMRDVSRIGVVQHERPAQVLLQSNAPDRVGRPGDTNHGLRWTGVGTVSDARGSERVNGARVPPGQEKRDAEAIRAFVARMQEPITQAELVKGRLVKKYAAQPGQDAGADNQLSQGRERPSPPPDKDLDR